jgi:coenzyme F420-reducing hydrogenase beta subunit
MKADSEGFLYPVVDNTRCTGCGLCKNACPVLNHTKADTAAIKAYACKNRNLAQRLQSSSGGVFTLIAQQVIDDGVVFGAAFDDSFALSHRCALSIEDLSQLRGSKYLQSEIGGSFEQVMAFLNSGRQVLFTGTPCQTRGLKNYIGRDYDNLLCADVICHGVPSPTVFKKYLTELESRYGAAAKSVSFRAKKPDWKHFSVEILFNNGKKYSKPFTEDIFMRGFLSNLFLRPSCHNCPVKNFRSGSDITLGDYWGVESVLPEFADAMGVSLVIANTVKGEAAIKKIAGNMDCLTADLGHAVKYNPCITGSVKPHKNRVKFFKVLHIKSLEKNIGECLKVSVIDRIKKHISFPL